MSVISSKNMFDILNVEDSSSFEEEERDVEVKMETTNEITNFMGGKSFKLFNPLNRLKLVAFSSF